MTDKAGKLNPGDLVRLKSSGPRMTVLRWTTLGYECAWFAKDDTPQTGIFPLEALEREEP